MLAARAKEWENEEIHRFRKTSLTMNLHEQIAR